MSRARVIELVNVLQYHLAKHGLENVPFGGKQVVIVNEFLQLRSVKSCCCFFFFFT